MAARLTRRNLLLLLVLAGVGIGAYLSWVALDDESEAFCSGVGDCHTVQSSEYADVAGIPVALLGFGMYLALAALVIGRRVGPRVVRGLPQLPIWTFALAAAGALYSAYLTYLELFVIDAICIWCVTSAGVITLIAALAYPDFVEARRAIAGRSSGTTV
jgi:uncharacterized membrane protein